LDSRAEDKEKQCQRLYGGETPELDWDAHCQEW
jgi:hypothetical protein